jgi:hypothetical protein
MVARSVRPDTVRGMTFPQHLVAARDHDVLAAVATALSISADTGEWPVLEAWVAALTAVNAAALQAVQPELRDLL